MAYLSLQHFHGYIQSTNMDGNVPPKQYPCMRWSCCVYAGPCLRKCWESGSYGIKYGLVLECVRSGNLAWQMIHWSGSKDTTLCFSAVQWESWVHYLLQSFTLSPLVSRVCSHCKRASVHWSTNEPWPPLHHHIIPLIQIMPNVINSLPTAASRDRHLFKARSMPRCPGGKLSKARSWGATGVCYP